MVQFTDKHKSILLQLENEPGNAALHLKFANLWMNNTHETLPQLLADTELVQAYEDHYIKAVKLEPNNAYFYCEYAIFLFWVKNEVIAAYSYFQHPLLLDPSDTEIYCDYAALLTYDPKELDHANLLYQRALEIDPDNIKIQYLYTSFLNDVKK